MDNYAIDKLKWQSGGVVLRVLAVRARRACSPCVLAVRQGPGFESSRVVENKTRGYCSQRNSAMLTGLSNF